MKKVSVIIPVYNTEKTLKECVDSILAQTYENMEIILVDDGSTDKSGEICDDFKNQDARIKVIHKKNGGLTDARKKGFDKSNGEYICFIDSDDFIEKSYVSHHVEQLENSDADISICGYFKFSAGRKVKVPLKAKKQIYNKQDFEKELIPPAIFTQKTDGTVIPNFLWLRMFRRRVIDDACFVSEREVYTEDIFFNFYSYDIADKVVISDIPLYYYRTGNNTLTTIYRENKWQMEQNRYMRLKKYCDKRKISVEDRFLCLIINAVTGTLINEARKKDYTAFSNCAKKILENPGVQQAIASADTTELSKGLKLRTGLLKTNSIRTLYLFEKTR